MDGRGHRRREACRPPFVSLRCAALHKRGAARLWFLEGKEGNSNCCSRERIIVAEQTGYRQAADRQCVLEAGFDHYLVKPADFEEVRQILAEVAEKAT